MEARELRVVLREALTCLENLCDRNMATVGDLRVRNRIRAALAEAAPTEPGNILDVATVIDFVRRAAAQDTSHIFSMIRRGRSWREIAEHCQAQEWSAPRRDGPKKDEPHA